jgi:hypothetical protein
MKEGPSTFPVHFSICGKDPKCEELNHKAKVTKKDLQELDCYQCLDPENAANLSFNTRSLLSWIRDMKNRCGKKEEKP